MLHLALSGIDEIFKHLLSPNANLKVVYFLLERLRHITFIDMLPYANIRGKRVIGLSEDVQGVADRRNEQLRMVPRNKVFVAAIVANGH